MKLKTSDDTVMTTTAEDSGQLETASDNRQFISGVPVAAESHREVLEAMRDSIDRHDPAQWISITNTESMYYALRNDEHRDFIQKARFSLCDGMGVVLAGRFWGHRVRRFNGPVLMLKACDFGRQYGWRHYFCGGREGVAQTLDDTLNASFPGMITAGMYCPPFRQLTEAETDEMIDNINAADPDIVWVGLGLLKQEAWIARFAPRLNASWLVGVGAAFDYHAGTARWAPAWIRAIGMEWLYRLCFEPRMFIRNVRSFQFMFSSMGSAIAARITGKKRMGVK